MVVACGAETFGIAEAPCDATSDVAGPTGAAAAVATGPCPRGATEDCVADDGEAVTPVATLANDEADAAADVGGSLAGLAPPAVVMVVETGAVSLTAASVATVRGEGGVE